MITKQNMIAPGDPNAAHPQPRYKMNLKSKINHPLKQPLVAGLAMLLICLPGRTAEYRDDFSSGINSWQTDSAWFIEGSGGDAAMTVDTRDDEFAWNSGIVLINSWAIETEFSLMNLYNDGNWTGTAGIALANDQNQLLYLADVIFSQDAYLYPGMGYYDGQWNNTLENNVWYPHAQNTVKLRLERPPGRNQLKYTVTCPNGFKQEYTSLPIPDSILNQITKVGLRGFKAKVGFSYVDVTTQLPSTLEIAMYPGLTIRGEPGTTFEIQYADAIDSTEWNPLTSITLESNVVTWFDTTAASAARRFYRAIEE